MIDFEAMIKTPSKPKILIKVPALKVLSRDILDNTLARDNPKKRHVTMTFEVRKLGENSYWINVIDGGATGYESISVDNLKEAVEKDINEGKSRPWSACFGGSSYPQLEVEGKTLIYLLKAAEAIIAAGLIN